MPRTQARRPRSRRSRIVSVSTRTVCRPTTACSGRRNAPPLIPSVSLTEFTNMDSTLIVVVTALFAFVLKTPGLDSWTATGLLGGSDGVVQLFTYDNLYGHGTLRTSACDAPRAETNADGFVFIACDTQQASLQMQSKRPKRLVGERLIWHR